MSLEMRIVKDACSGVEVTQFTDYKGHSHHFYFTNPGWYDGGRKLLISSDRNNRTNLFGVDLVTGHIEQLTDLEPVPLPRELEFLRACKNPVREEVYFWHDLRLLALDLIAGATRVLYEIDPRWSVSMTNCSADGRYVYCGTWEDLSNRFRVDLLRGYVGFAEIWAAKPLSQILEVATDGSGGRVSYEEKYWIGHVNTSPVRDNLLTFCHEGPWDRVDCRIWGLETTTGKTWKIRPTSEGERVGHEYWYADGVRIGYHGGRVGGRPILGRIRYDDTDRFETDFPGQTGHIFSHDEKVIVGDGDGVIRTWKWENERYAGPRVLCRHDSSMHIQQAHPHPRISPDRKNVVFTSDREGYCNVYMAPLAEFESLPPVEE